MRKRKEREKEKCGLCPLPSGGKSVAAWDVWLTGMSWKLPEVMLQKESLFREPGLGRLEEGPQCVSFQGLGTVRPREC